MDFFPTQILTASINGSKEEFFRKLKAATEVKRSLVTLNTKRTFIGLVSDSGFKLITSKVGIGSLALMHFEYHEEFPPLKVTLNPPFKLLFLVFTILVAITGFLGFVQSDMSNFTMLFVPLIAINVFRLLIGVFFTISSKIGLAQLQKHGLLIN